MTMPSMSRALSVRAARSTLSAPMTPTRSPSATDSCRIGAAAADQQHGRVVERIGGFQFGRQQAARGERIGAAQHGRVQRADAQRRGEPARDALDGSGGGNAKRVGNADRDVVAGAGNDRDQDAAGFLAPFGQRALAAQRYACRCRKYRRARSLRARRTRAPPAPRPNSLR